MRNLTSELAARRINEVPATFPKVVDLGASRGSAIAALKAQDIKPSAEFWGLEESQPMLDVMRERFATDRYVFPTHCDLRHVTNNTAYGLSPGGTSVIMSVLTLMFIPMEHRQRVLQVMYDALEPGGYFLYVEKILGSSARMNSILADGYYAMKARNGYTQEEIDTKKTSLEGVLVPLTYDMHLSMLKQAGFRHVDTYFRHYNFCGMLAIK